jgi:hypothetical protein
MVHSPMTVTTGSSSLPKLLYVGKGIKRQETQECKPPNHYHQITPRQREEGLLDSPAKGQRSFVGHGAFTNDRDDRVLEPPQATVCRKGNRVAGDPGVQTTKSLCVGEKRDSKIRQPKANECCWSW